MKGRVPVHVAAQIVLPLLCFALVSCAVADRPALEASASAEGVAVPDRAEAHPEAATTPTVGPALEMSYVAGGRTVDENDVASLCVASREVTISDYLLCLDAGECSGPDRTLSECAYFDPEAHRPELPMTCVSQEMAEEFCTFVEMRLPSELEWQWVAYNGAARTKFPWGDEKATPDHLNLDFRPSVECSVEVLPPGSRPMGNSSSGVSDLQGNVSEWTSRKDGTDGYFIGMAVDECFNDSLNYGGSAVTAGSSSGLRLVGFRCVRSTPNGGPDACLQHKTSPR